MILARTWHKLKTGSLWNKYILVPSDFVERRCLLFREAVFDHRSLDGLVSIEVALLDSPNGLPIDLG